MVNRKIKIQPKWIANVNPKRKIHETVVPEIRISGKWLEKNGFKPNDVVLISVEVGRLIIQHQ